MVLRGMVPRSTLRAISHNDKISWSDADCKMTRRCFGDALYNNFKRGRFLQSLSLIFFSTKFNVFFSVCTPPDDLKTALI